MKNILTLIFLFVILIISISNITYDKQLSGGSNYKNKLIGRWIGKGKQGQIYDYIDNDDNHMITKVIKIYDSNNDYINIRKEMVIMSLASQYNLAPKVYNHNNNFKNAILMQKLINFQPLEQLLPFLNTFQINIVFENIKLQVHRLHAIGIAHNDLHSSNILVKHSSVSSFIIIFVDFTRSTTYDNNTISIINKPPSYFDNFQIERQYNLSLFLL